MNLLRRLAIAAAAAVLSSALALPGIARGGASTLPAWACAPGETGTARGPLAGPDGKVREPDLGSARDNMPAHAKGAARSDFSATVPVYFHVITDGSLGDLTDRQIADQIRVLNRTFSGREGGADGGFTFDLVGITRTDDATWYASRSGGAERAMKQALRQGGDDALNVYSTSGGAYLGWAYLPDITDTKQAYLDGIVIDWRTVPGASTEYAGRYDLGETLTHEAGHWLNLEHTFYGGCNRTGDYVDDTPPEKSPSFGCPEGKDTCPASGLDPIHNYMDYSYDSCLTEFTPGQVQRMRDAWLLYRAP